PVPFPGVGERAATRGPLAEFGRQFVDGPNARERGHYWVVGGIERHGVAGAVHGVAVMQRADDDLDVLYQEAVAVPAKEFAGSRRHVVGQGVSFAELAPA